MGVKGVTAYVWFAYLGAGAAGALVFFLGRAHTSGAHPLRLVLAGAGLSVALGSLTGIIVINSPVQVLDDFRNWSAGSVEGRSLQVAFVLAASLAAGGLICFTLARGLNALMLGQESGRALGLNPPRIWALACVAVMLLAGGATAAAGPISFVGLVAPHLARSVGRANYGWILVFSALFGALLLLGADIIGRMIAAPDEGAAHDRRARRGCRRHYRHAGRRAVLYLGRPSLSDGAGMKLVTLGPYSLLLRPRALLVALVMLGVLTLIGFALLGTGTLNVPPLDVARTLSGHAPDLMAERIIWQIRLPRLLTAILVGGALGVAGAVFQSISRNALGSPDVIGFTSGAATGAIVQIILFNAGPWLTAVSAMASGMAVAVIVLLLSRRDGGGRLVLVGIGFGALLAGINTVLLVMGNLDQAASAQLWLAGSLNMRGWTHVATIGVGIACLLPPILALSRQLNILEMGDDTAAQLGLHPERLRLVMVLLAGVAGGRDDGLCHCDCRADCLYRTGWPTDRQAPDPRARCADHLRRAGRRGAAGGGRSDQPTLCAWRRDAGGADDRADRRALSGGLYLSPDRQGIMPFAGGARLAQTPPAPRCAIGRAAQDCFRFWRALRL
ncbi:iron chelate uptake ABC transporter family permease subunit [Ketogulonicigenium vulgare]|uniref:iron chelate uptake ABC transporter family permease subunit n=1 Tax=Ketogulonicigenium vulgare TaxID=92945 RepID=UPI0002FDB31C